MSDDNDSGGIIGSLISIFILIAIWPYLLALLGIYIAYLAVLAALEWISQNPLTVVLILLGVLCVYAIFHYRLLTKVWRWLIIQLKPKTADAHLYQEVIDAKTSALANRTFIPSTNLYCYWCTKKLGMKAWEKDGKYFCNNCKEKQMLAVGSK
ncbi:hypothetical protein [Polynucleobacter sp. AP-Melu-500A-A1]|uniref:hypothetical protein n=1 Tax=Polynucleobacter sp. AP-Melu-500A-A1 TaxID=2576929 RepID=UPI001C0C0CE6|nr:hypothetical protein [Polynucleobacter sp. AP-Melu-500A-A1]MBU3630528.1 hypothetical protein [Polynucleobacter sp. AP-Melu-500A-A1]